MKITETWLRKRGACEKGTDWFLRHKKADAVSVLKALILEG